VSGATLTMYLASGKKKHGELHVCRRYRSCTRSLLTLYRTVPRRSGLLAARCRQWGPGMGQENEQQTEQILDDC
jgi:hypothetical protein